MKDKYTRKATLSLFNMSFKVIFNNILFLLVIVFSTVIFYLFVYDFLYVDILNSDSNNIKIEKMLFPF